MTDLILYTMEDGRSQIKLRAQVQTVWLTQLKLTEFFQYERTRTDACSDEYVRLFDAFYPQTLVRT